MELIKKYVAINYFESEGTFTGLEQVIGEQDEKELYNLIGFEDKKDYEKFKKSHFEKEKFNHKHLEFIRLLHSYLRTCRDESFFDTIKDISKSPSKDIVSQVNRLDFLDILQTKYPIVVKKDVENPMIVGPNLYYKYSINNDMFKEINEILRNKIFYGFDVDISIAHKVENILKVHGNSLAMDDSKAYRKLLKQALVLGLTVKELLIECNVGFIDMVYLYDRYDSIFIRENDKHVIIINKNSVSRVLLNSFKDVVNMNELNEIYIEDGITFCNTKNGRFQMLEVEYDF